MEGKDYRKAAEEIIRIVGKDNIVSATHCATRLRLIVKDKEAIDVKKLEKLPLVKGTFFNAGQFQIILGTGIVNKVYEEIENLGLKTLSKKEQDEAIKNQQKGVKRLMRILGDIFIPIIPVIAATGLFLGLKGCVFNDNVLGLFGASTDMIPDYIVTLVNVLTETAFSFLPAIHLLVCIQGIRRNTGHWYGTWSDARFTNPAKCIFGSESGQRNISNHGIWKDSNRWMPG